MNSKKVTLVLRQGEEIGTGRVAYTVVELSNTVEWAIGEVLDKKAVEDINGRRQHPVEIRIKG